MSRPLFVTGTSTGVGKTVITRALARAATLRGIDTVALKPVETGVDLQRNTDAFRSAAAAGGSVSIDQTCLYAFKEPISPHLAARLENRGVDPARMVRFLAEWASRAELVIAEGAGGLLVPLVDGVTFAEVIAGTDYSLLIVAPNVLGTINQTLLTIEAARHRNIPVAGVVLNRGPERELGNKEAIEQYGRVQVIGEFPTVSMDDDDLLAAAAESCFDLDRLFE